MRVEIEVPDSEVDCVVRALREGATSRRKLARYSTDTEELAKSAELLDVVARKIEDGSLASPGLGDAKNGEGLSSERMQQVVREVILATLPGHGGWCYGSEHPETRSVADRVALRVAKKLAGWVSPPLASLLRAVVLRVTRDVLDDPDTRLRAIFDTATAVADRVTEELAGRPAADVEGPGQDQDSSAQSALRVGRTSGRALDEASEERRRCTEEPAAAMGVDVLGQTYESLLESVTRNLRDTGLMLQVSQALGEIAQEVGLPTSEKNPRPARVVVAVRETIAGLRRELAQLGRETTMAQLVTGLLLVTDPASTDGIRERVRRELLAWASRGAATPEVVRDALLASSVDELDLSVRASNFLLGMKIRTIGDLVRQTEQDLRSRGSNARTIQEYSQELSKLGLSLAPRRSREVVRKRYRAARVRKTKS